MVDQFIFKIVSRAEWELAQSIGTFKGASIDLSDGYIHFSTANQVKETAAKHFKGQHDLLLVAVRADIFGDELKWEVSRGGALFPHLYAQLDTGAVAWVKPLPLNAQGDHQWPDF